MGIFHQAENNVLKFYGDHVLIKFFFGCIIDIQKKKKKYSKGSDENLIHWKLASNWM